MRHYRHYMCIVKNTTRNGMASYTLRTHPLLHQLARRDCIHATERRHTHPATTTAAHHVTAIIITASRELFHSLSRTRAHVQLLCTECPVMTQTHSTIRHVEVGHSRRTTHRHTDAADTAMLVRTRTRTRRCRSTPVDHKCSNAGVVTLQSIHWLYEQQQLVRIKQQTTYHVRTHSKRGTQRFN